MNNSGLFVWILLMQMMSVSLGQLRRVCYYNSQSKHRLNRATFFPEDIDPNLCSHIIYSHAIVQNDNLVPLEPNDIAFDNGPGFYLRIMDLKEINPSLKVMLGVGGDSLNAYMFENVAQSDEKINSFAYNVVQFLNKWRFDGLDLEWYYPIGNSENFTKLVEAIKLSFLEASYEYNSNLLLSIAVSADRAAIDNSYQVQALNELVDFVNLKSFDFHDFNENKTAFNSALYPRSEEKFWETNSNAAWAVDYWLKSGLDSDKLVMGIPFYGTGYVLEDKNVNAVGSPSKGPSSKSIYINESGVIPYFEICQLIKTRMLTETFDQEQQVASIQIQSTWIGYENEASLERKGNFIKQKCLGGFSVWNVDFDDWKGSFCQKTPYPLLNALNNALKDYHYSCGVNTSSSTNQAPVESQPPKYEYSSYEASSSHQPSSTFIYSSTSQQTSESYEEYTPIVESSTLPYDNEIEKETTKLIPSSSTVIPETTTPIPEVKTSSVEASTSPLPETTSESKPSVVSSEATTQHVVTTPKETEEEVRSTAEIKSTTDAPTTQSTSVSTQSITEETILSTSAPTTTTTEQQSTSLPIDSNNVARTTPVSMATEEINQQISSTTEAFSIISSTESSLTLITDSITATSSDNQGLAEIEASTSPKIEETTTTAPSTETTETSTMPTSSATSTTTKETTTTTVSTTTTTKLPRTTITSTVVTTTTQASTEQDHPIISRPTLRFSCTKSEILPSPISCQYFQVCLKGYPQPVAVMSCAAGYYFHPDELTCVNFKPYTCNLYPPIGTSNRPVATTTTRYQPITRPSYKPSTTPRPTSMAVVSAQKFKCPKLFGYFDHQTDCHKFWHCSHGLAYLKTCPKGLIFNSKLSVCAYTSNLKKCQSKSSYYQYHAAAAVAPSVNYYQAPNYNNYYQPQAKSKTAYKYYPAQKKPVYPSYNYYNHY